MTKSLRHMQINERAVIKTVANDPQWTVPAVLALIVFVLLYAPCFVTVVAMARESSWQWALFAVVFNTVLAYGLAVLIFQVGSRL